MKAKFGKVTNEDGESDVRAEIDERTAVERAKAPEEEGRQEKHRALLAEVMKIVNLHTDDQLHSDLKMNKVHVGMLRELSEKPKHILSDGNCEMIWLSHEKLKKSGKL